MVSCRLAFPGECFFFSPRHSMVTWKLPLSWKCFRFLCFLFLLGIPCIHSPVTLFLFVCARGRSTSVGIACFIALIWSQASVSCGFCLEPTCMTRHLCLDISTVNFLFLPFLNFARVVLQFCVLFSFSSVPGSAGFPLTPSLAFSQALVTFVWP